MIEASATAWREPWRTRWARRSITLVAYPAGLAVYSLIVLPLLPLLLAVDVVRRSHFAITRASVFFGYYLVCEIGGLLAAALLWAAYRLSPGVGRAAFMRWNFRLQCLWARLLGGGGFRIFGMKLEYDGPGDLGRRPLLLFVRHASTADTILAAMLVAARHDIVLRYVLKRELLWDPCLDIVGNRLRNVFVRRGGEDTDSDLASIRQLATNVGAREGVLIYPEGTRFTPTKRRKILDRLAQCGDPSIFERAACLTHVLPPRRGGALALLEGASSWDVAVCAHAGLEGAASFADLWNGTLVGSRVQVRIRVFPGEAIPTTTDGRARWLYERWAEVDAFVAKHTKGRSSR
jgi:1-acyl-sn-glycerol-3-phosphate acyltransferase